jgi:precorrin-2 dehydrogenase/sirohydrochlorin ferrochelatase
MEGSLYPIFLKLQGRSVLVVGAGKVALNKIRQLLKTGAKLTVIAPKALEEIQILAETMHLVWHNREFRISDVEGNEIVIAATGNRKINMQVRDSANEKGIFSNVVDDPELCDFYVPAVISRGQLTIAISSSGLSPAFARKLKEELEDYLPDYLENFLQLLLEARAIIKKKFPDDYLKRKAANEAIIDSEARKLAELGKSAEAWEKILRIIEKF